jgi:hypothetical protein
MPFSMQLEGKGGVKCTGTDCSEIASKISDICKYIAKII